MRALGALLEDLRLDPAPTRRELRLIGAEGPGRREGNDSQTEPPVVRSAQRRPELRLVR